LRDHNCEPALFRTVVKDVGSSSILVRAIWPS
jgi:hypothetical protein